jgi:importin-5
VIFRRIASKTRKNAAGENADMFISMPKNDASVVRDKLLETLAAESDRGVRNKISDAVAEVARQYAENSQCIARSHERRGAAAVAQELTVRR